MGEIVAINSMGGEVPQLDPRLLQPGQAQVAANCRLSSGVIEAFQGMLEVAADLVGGVQTIYRLPDDAGTDYWLSWATDVDVALGAHTEEGRRVYWTGDGEPRMATVANATTGGGPYPGAFFVLGVPRPKATASVSPSGGASATNVDRSYRYTFVTPLGEEGPASAPSTVTTGKLDATWDLSGLSTAPPNSGTVSAAEIDQPSNGYTRVTLDTVDYLRVGEQIVFASVGGMTELNGTWTIEGIDTGTNKVWVALDATNAYTAGGTWARKAPHNVTGMVKRIYRTVVSSGVTTFRFVAEIAVATTTYADTIADLNLGEALATADWEQPPATMKGIVAFSNQMMAGFDGRYLCFSEVGQPHAWPSKYQVSVDYPIVAIAPFGESSLCIGTTGYPALADGSAPEQMSVITRKENWPCLSKRGMASLGFAVLYPTTEGLAMYGVSGEKLVTEGFFDKKRWKERMPATFKAGVYEGRYYAAHDTPEGGASVLVFDRDDPVQVARANIAPSFVYTDAQSAELYFLIGGEIFQWDANEGVRMVWDWTSGEYVFAKPVSMGYAKVDADFTMSDAEIAAAEAAAAAISSANLALITGLATRGALNELALNEVPINGSLLADAPPVTWDSLSFQWIADGEVVSSHTITDDSWFRLAEYAKEDTGVARVSGNLTVRRIFVAQTFNDTKRA